MSQPLALTRLVVLDLETTGPRCAMQKWRNAGWGVAADSAIAVRL